MHLVEAAGKRILLDCGLFRGRRAEARERNWTFPFDPTSIDAVVLSHAHVDHCGNLPRLHREGFAGPIYCTPATRDLVAVMLADSARIQEDEAFRFQLAACRLPLGKSSPPSALRPPPSADEPLYTRSDAQRTLEHCVPIPYNQDTTLGPALQVRLTDAGHLLGSATVQLTAAQGGREFRITFTGDLGRRGLPFLPEPSPVPEADLIISESTYGGRQHATVEAMAARMSETVRGAIDRGGKVLIPAFSLGRTQIVVHYLRQWMHAGVIPPTPLYVDSPLAMEIAAIHAQHAEAFEPDEKGLEAIPVRYFLSKKEARRRTSMREPCIIVASGGMCEGGRILDHLRTHIDDPRCAVVLVSYQGVGSLGAQLLERKPTVRFAGRTWPKWIEVIQLNGFSGHADHDDFLALLGPAAENTRRICLVHGELEQAEILRQGLLEKGCKDVVVPARAESVAVA
jgi:metallo-beta-lactamase family protein